MMKVNSLFTLWCIACFASSFNPVNAQILSNKNATKETVALYKNLNELSNKHVLFGHQDDLAYGVNWKYQDKRSDIKDIVNDYPAVYGWDLGRIEHNSSKNIDNVPFSKMKKYIQDGYKRGGVITLSWHFDNPLSGGSSWDTTQNTIATILPGGKKHELYKNWLNNAASFIHSLKGDNNEAIPILFRPFHEVTGDWFWWGKKTASPQQFKEAWAFTVNYLRETKKLNQLIMVYNVNDFSNEEEFLAYYPGDELVDVLSFDKYQFENNSKKDFITSTRNQLHILTQLAKNKNKLAAFAETGFEAIPDAHWWTETLWPAIKDFPISYVLVWRNAGYMPSMKKMHYYAPYKGHQSEKDFIKFYKNEKILFEKKLALKNIYQK